MEKKHAVESTHFSVLGASADILSDASVQKGRVVAVYKGKPLVASAEAILYEPQIKALLGISQFENVSCLFEKTCGAIVYTEQDEVRKFLLIKNESGHIGFPKGHIELNETEFETAVREVFEETGLKISPERAFRSEYNFTTLDDTYKKCVYFLAHYDYMPAKIQESEISNSWLVPYKEAIELLNWEQDKTILEEAQKELEKAL